MYKVLSSEARQGQKGPQRSDQDFKTLQDEFRLLFKKLLNDDLKSISSRDSPFHPMTLDFLSEDYEDKFCVA
jgi:hypothetical protein